MKIRLLLLFGVIAIGCGPGVSRFGYDITGKTIDPDCTVVVIENAAVDSSNAVLLGSVRIGDTGFSIDCGENKVISMLKVEACLLGADIINLYDIKTPDILSSCYRVKADFYKLNKANDVSTFSPSIKDNAAGTKLQAVNAPSQILGYMSGFLLGYLITSLLF